MIWVLKKDRNQGVARSLVESLTNHCNSQLDDLAHMLPFSKGVLHFWKQLRLSTIYVVAI